MDIIFNDKIDNLTYEEICDLCTNYLHMQSSFLEMCDDEEWEVDKPEFIKDFKATLKGDMTVDTMFTNYWCEEYDGENVQSFFRIYEYLANK